MASPDEAQEKEDDDDDSGSDPDMESLESNQGLIQLSENYFDSVIISDEDDEHEADQIAEAELDQEFDEQAEEDDMDSVFDCDFEDMEEDDELEL